MPREYTRSHFYMSIFVDSGLSRTCILYTICSGKEHQFTVLLINRSRNGTAGHTGHNPGIILILYPDKP